MISWLDILAGLARSTALSSDHLSSLGPVHEDAVNVGIFLKSDRKIAEFRPRVRSVLLSLYLPYELTDARFARHCPLPRIESSTMINLTSADQVDDQLRGMAARGLRLQHRLAVKRLDSSRKPPAG